MKKKHPQGVLTKKRHRPSLPHFRVADTNISSVLLPERFGDSSPLAPSAPGFTRMSPECDPPAVLLPESFTPSVGLPCPVLRALRIAQYSVLFVRADVEDTLAYSNHNFKSSFAFLYSLTDFPKMKIVFFVEIMRHVSTIALAWRTFIGTLVTWKYPRRRSGWTTR